MPLKSAVDKEYSEIVYYLVKTVKQDIGNFDKVIIIYAIRMIHIRIYIHAPQLYLQAMWE